MVTFENFVTLLYQTSGLCIWNPFKNTNFYIYIKKKKKRVPEEKVLYTKVMFRPPYKNEVATCEQIRCRKHANDSKLFS